MKNKRIKKFFLRFCAVVLIIAAIPFVLDGLVYILVYILAAIAIWSEMNTPPEKIEKYERITGQVWQEWNTDGFKTCDRYPDWEKCVDLCNRYPESTRSVRQRMEAN